MANNFDLTNVGDIRRLLRDHNVMIKKRLGQHFLINRQVLTTIIDAGQINKDDNIIEIGAGLGVLTAALCQKAKKVITYEQDQSLGLIARSGLEKRYQNFELIIADFLKSPLSMTVSFKVIANLPYQITTPVIRRFLERGPRPEKMVLLVQKEVGERLAAKPGSPKRGWVSVLGQLSGSVTVVKWVPKEDFWPIPAVDSAILMIDNIKQKPKDFPRLLQIIKAGFSAKRRQLPNSLTGGLGIELEKARALVEAIGVDATRRAETLTNDEWLKLKDTWLEMI